MSIKITKSDVKWSYLSLILLNGVNIFLLPFLLIHLSAAEIGLWYTFTAISGLVVILDFGFMTTLSRNVSFVWSGADTINSTGYSINKIMKNEPNYKLFIKLFKTTKIIYFFISLIILLFLLSIGSYYIYNVAKDEILVSKILISWFIYVIAVYLNMKYAYWNAILKGIGAVKRNQQLLIITKIVQLLLSIILLLLGYGIMGIATAYLTSIIVNRVLANRMFFAYQSNRIKLKPLMKEKFSIREFKEMFNKVLPNTYKQGLISISNYMTLRSTTLLCSAFLGLSTSAALGVTLQIITLINSVANTFFNTYLTQFSNYRINRNFIALKFTFIKSIKISYLITFISYGIIISIGNEIFNLLNSNIEILSWEYTLVVMIYCFLYNNHSLFATFLATKNELPHYKSFIISGVLILGSQFLLLLLFKPTLWHILMPILLIQLLYNNWKWPLESIKELKSLK